MRRCASTWSAVCSSRVERRRDRDVVEEPRRLRHRHRMPALAHDPVPDLRGVRGPLLRSRDRERRGSSGNFQSSAILGACSRRPAPATRSSIAVERSSWMPDVREQRQQSARLEHARPPSPSRPSDRPSGRPWPRTPRRRRRRAAPHPRSARCRSGRRPPSPIALARGRDEIGARLDGADAQAAGDQQLGQLAGPAADLEHRGDGRRARRPRARHRRARPGSSDAPRRTRPQRRRRLRRTPSAAGSRGGSPQQNAAIVKFVETAVPFARFVCTLTEV